MNKIIGTLDYFSSFKVEDVVIVVGCNLTQINEELYSWNELYYFKKNGKPSFEEVKDDILNCINNEVEEKILDGYQWTVLHGEDAGVVANVWLSKENQNNFKAKHDAAKEYPQLVTWPMKYKIGEKEDKTPVYEYFQNIEELAQFYLGGIAYIEQCYNDGWVKKDSIDWTPYEEALNPQSEVTEEPTEE